MESLRSALFFATLLSGAAFAGPSTPAAGQVAPTATGLAAQLIALETGTWEAVKKQAVKAFAEVCLPDCIEIWGDGSVLTIQEVLAQVPDTVLSEVKLEDFKVTFPADDTALIRYRVRTRSAYKGQATPPR
jgi:Domain of unknown function (DUF4440)